MSQVGIQINGVTFAGGSTISSSGTGSGGGGGDHILSLLGSVAPSGTTLVDQSGNENDFNWNGTNPYDFINPWYDFTNATATNNSNTLFDAITNQMTIFSWVRFPNGFSGSLSIMAREPSFALRVDNGGHVNLVKYNIADQDVSYSFESTSAWYHICAIQGPTQVTYVVNGNVIGTANNSSNFNNSSNPVFLGYDAYTEAYAPVQLARLDVWNGAKSVSDAQSAWDSQKTSYGY